MSERVNHGDRMRITIEGVYFDSDPDLAPGLPVGTFREHERDFDVFSAGEDVVTIERLAPAEPVVVFKPGDRVRNKVSGNEYTIGNYGYFCHGYNQWVSYELEFTGDSYEKVVLHEALF